MNYIMDDLTKNTIIHLDLDPEAGAREDYFSGFDPN